MNLHDMRNINSLNSSRYDGFTGDRWARKVTCFHTVTVRNSNFGCTSCQEGRLG